MYAFRTHDSVEMDVLGNERWMLGKAMLTIVASTNEPAEPSEAIASTTLGRGTAPAQGGT